MALSMSTNSRDRASVRTDDTIGERALVQTLVFLPENLVQDDGRTDAAIP